MKVLLVIVATLILSAGAQAQLRKCTGSDGKVTYSDVLCVTAATEGTIKNSNGNSLDTSGFRNGIQRDQASQIERANANSASAQSLSGCDAAQADYKAALSSKKHYVNQIQYMPEYIAMNAKCGQESSQPPKATRSALLTREVVEGVHKICIYSDGSSVSVSGVGVCALRK